jgi:hypothetical protein
MDRMSSKDTGGCLPGEEIVKQGLADLASGSLTESALVLLVAGPRLRRLGLAIPDQPPGGPFEHALYETIEQRLGPAAHSHYNGLIRRIVSYARALEREQSSCPS